MMRLTGLVLLSLLGTAAVAQENSPYSRYGLGDLVPSQHISSRAMGGISAGYSNPQGVNFVNPASYGNLGYSFQPLTTFDFGAEIDNRQLQTINPTSKYSATNLIVSYVQLGMPLKLRKANKKGIFMGLQFGLRPVSRVNYKILKTERKLGIDSMATLFEGSGGVSEAMVGAGIRIKHFNLGFNTGYRFGNKDYSTKISFVNDTVAYYSSNSATKSNFGGMFLNLGAMYDFNFKNNSVLRLGAYTSLSQQMKGTEETLRETVQYDQAGAMYRVDSVFQSSVSGTVTYPQTWGAGFTYGGKNWLFGADYEHTQWAGYRFFNKTDDVQNTWKIRAGAEYFPARDNTPANKYFQFVKYRAGFYYGPDYVNLGTSVPEYAFTFGAGFPLKLRRTIYESQYSVLNASVEIGSRGNKSSALRENFYRISFGFSLSDLWFNRSKYY